MVDDYLCCGFHHLAIFFLLFLIVNPNFKESEGRVVVVVLFYFKKTLV